MKTRKTLLCISLFFFAGVSLRIAGAQAVEMGSITGRLSDSGGAAVAGAEVSAATGSAGLAARTTTDAVGAYKLELAPGTYSVTFSDAGFQKAEVRKLEVVAGRTQVISVTLAAGQENEIVLMEWDAFTEQVQPVVTPSSQSDASLQEVPLSSRNYTQAAGLASGVSSQVSNATAIGMNSQGVHVGSGMTTSFLMDGVAVADSSGGTDAAAAPNPDAIETNSTQSWSYSAGPERYSGANITVNTKSGTNAFHGTLFESVRNDIFNANDFFRKRKGLPLPVLKQNQFGFTLGGPIKRERAFFFLAYQGTRQSNGFAGVGFSSSVTLPPVPEDRTKEKLGAAFCPDNHPDDDRYKTLLGGVQVACDGSNINPVAINLLNLKLPGGAFAIPGSGSDSFQTVPFSIPATFREDQAIVNSDFVLSEKQKLTQKFYYSHDPQKFNFTGGPRSLPGSQMKVLNGAIYALVRLSSTITEALSNELHVSGQRYVQMRTPQVPFTNEQAGIASVVPQINILDSINVAGLFVLGGQNQWETYKINQYQLADQVSWTHGKHAIRVGLEVDRRQWNIQMPAYARGSLSIESISDLLLGLPGCPPGDANCSVANPVVNGVMTNGSAFSNVYGSQGASSTAFVTSPTGIEHALRYNEASGYFQDDFRILPRLTLNAAVRWDYFGHPIDSTGNITNFWPSLAKPWTVPPPGGTYEGYVVPSNRSGTLPAGVFRNSQKTLFPKAASLLNFAPRLGFSMQPFDNANLVIRGGYGLFYDRPDVGNMNQQPMAAVPYAVPVGGSGQANYQASLAQPYPQKTLGWGPTRMVDFTSGQSTNLNVNILDESFSVPFTQKWNLEIQKQLPGGLNVVIGYAGAHSVRLQNTPRQINVARIAGPSSPVNGITSSTVKNAALRVPFLGIAANGLNDEQTQGSAKYNGLQAVIGERARNGLHAQGTFMFSKTLSNASTNSNSPLDLRQQYGRSAASAPMRLAVTYGWDFPWKVQGVAGKLLNGWGFSGTTILQSGTPMTISDTRGGTIYGNASVSRAQLCPGMTVRDAVSHGSLKERLDGYFNKAAFADTSVTTNDPTCALPAIGDGTGYGNSGVGIILGPGQANTDLSLSRGIEMKGSSIEFQAEFFNAFNHPQFGLPDLSVTNASFGKITSTSVNPRLIQFALKYSF